MCYEKEQSSEEVEKDFSLDEDYARQTQAFHAGEHDKIEEGTCLCCGQHYTKNLEQSNLSRSGYCVECGWNP